MKRDGYGLGPTSNWNVTYGRHSDGTAGEHNVITKDEPRHCRGSLNPVSEAQSLSGKYGIQVIAGVELDCVQAGCSFHLLGYGFLCTFEIDRLQTEEINHAVKSHRCECSDCQWFYRYMNQLPSSAKAFFVETVLDPVKCQELWAYFPNDNGFTHYSGYFYIAVKKVEASKPFKYYKRLENA